MTETTTETGLEKETCGRCGGSGRYSYNQIDGDRCYGCGGKGVRYTKRGAAAAEFLRNLRKVPASSIKVGDFIELPSGPFSRGGFAQVEKVGYSTGSKYRGKDGEWHPYYSLKTAKGGINTFPDAMIRKGFSPEEKAEQMKKALAFQATLTKVGKPKA